MSNNVIGGQPNAVVCKAAVSFATAGITSGNTAIIYKVGNPLLSYVPGRSINGITGFEVDAGYYIVAITSQDLTAYCVPPTVVLTQLATPGGFTAVHSGSTGMALNWSAVTSATGYVLQRATDVGFTVGVTTLVAGTNVLTFTDSGLTALTQYFYRVKAQASGFTDSNYATANDTTAATGPAFVTWAGGVGSGLEVYNTAKGVRTKSGEAGNWGAHHEAWSVETLVTGKALTLKIDASAVGGHGMFGLNATRTADYSGTGGTSFPVVGFQMVSGVLSYYDHGGSAVSAGYTFAANDLIRLRYTAGTIVAEKSTDAGSTWTTLHTFSSISGSLLFGMQIYGNISLEGFSEISIL